jgi:hypothetical protein
LSKASSLRALGVGAALVALGVLGVAGAASGSSAKAKDDVAKFSMERKGKKIFFEGPDSVESGAKLKVENNTNPRIIGPHTFSVVERSALPKGLEEKRECGRLQRICGEIAQAHEADPQTGQVGEPNVDEGKKGWDKPTTHKSFGDSWFTQKNGERESREVSADGGENLWFICAVHPQMQTKVEVRG